jgi:rifampicin phosphotransferase
MTRNASAFASIDVPQVVSLTDPIGEQQVGGKAWNLARLVTLGLDVPAARVLTRAALSECTRDFPLPQIVRDAADECVAGIGAVPWIVRSSAIGEDSADASFAGQLDSVADVTTHEGLYDAVLRVWMSQWSPRALAYQRARRISLGGMGVIVQRQIRSAISGVLFTIAPDDDSVMLLEYCAGHGEALVSGRENPGRITISRGDVTWSHLAGLEAPDEREALILCDATIATLGHAALRIEQAFGRPQDIEWTLDASGRLWILQSRPITGPAKARHDAGPAEAGRYTGPPRGGQYVRWSNANVNENFPAPISPLLYSIARDGYYHYFRSLGRAFGISRQRLERMDDPLRHIIGVHGARMYYNLTSIHAVLRSAPFGEVLSRSFNQFVGCEATATPGASPFHSRGRSLLVQSGELGRIALKTTWQYLFINRRVRRFERTVDGFARTTRPDHLAGRDLASLLENLRGFVDIRRHKWNDAALADAASMVCYGLLERLLAATCSDAGDRSVHNSLLKALPDLVSSRPAIELWRLAESARNDDPLRQLFERLPAADLLETVRREDRFVEFRRAFDAYVERWGFRRSGELMLTIPSFDENAVPLFDLLKTYVGAAAAPPEMVLARQAHERVEATARIAEDVRRRAPLPWLPGLAQRLLFLLLLRATQRSICLRERARLKQALLYTRLRHICLAIGDHLSSGAVQAGRHTRHLQAREDVFFLTVEELDELISGSAMFPHSISELVALRRRAHTELGAAAAPADSLTLPRGEYLPRLADAEGDEDSHSDAPCAVRRTALRGTGACGGIATATAAILNDLAEAPRLCDRDVLVTRQTDPGWAAVFPLISGLVLERGGMLSHGAIIAREFGIPSVVGVRRATTHIPHGATVRVDGDRGMVEVLSESKG